MEGRSPAVDACNYYFTCLKPTEHDRDSVEFGLLNPSDRQFLVTSTQRSVGTLVYNYFYAMSWTNFAEITNCSSN